MCATKFIVYLLTCLCNKQYIGCTTRTFTVRVNEHLTNIKNGKTNHTVPRHYLDHHVCDPTGTKFVIIDKFVPHWRGESRTRGVSRLETYWISSSRPTHHLDLMLSGTLIHLLIRLRYSLSFIFFISYFPFIYFFSHFYFYIFIFIFLPFL